MQIKVNKLQKTAEGDVYGTTAIVIFLDKGNIVHEERFTGKLDSAYKRDVKWEGVYDKHEAVLLNGGEFEYELILDEGKDQSALASLLDKSSGELLKAPIKKHGAKGADK